MILAKINESTKAKYIVARLTTDELVAYEKEGFMPIQSSDSRPEEFRLMSKRGYNLWVGRKFLVIKDTDRPPVTEFSLKDLESGMVVETIFNNLFLVIAVGNAKYIINDGISVCTDRYDDNLSYTCSDIYKGALTLKRVYKPFYDNSSLDEKFSLKYLVWDREEERKEGIRKEINRLQKELKS